MAETNQLRNPWLVAAWPGMGNVAVAAAGFLIENLEAKPIGELPSRGLFDLQHVEVAEGLARAGRLPRNLFFQWSDPRGEHDLLIFIGEAQPQTGGYVLCQQIVEFAASRGVQRMFTFAAMATQLHPSNPPRVFGAATEPPMLQELKALEVELLKEGQISGLNGVLLAAAAERKVPGVCLLGELPFFAVGVPNPRASLAVLEIFTTMAGFEVDLEPLREQSAAMEQALLQLLERLSQAAREQGESEEGFTVPEFARGEESAADDDETDEQPTLDPAAQQRIETMFARARQDRSRAFELKQELDRLGVFKHYEDRFLDLFRKAE